MFAETHTEAAFETVIDAHLRQNGYTPVAHEGFDRDRAIFPETVLAFIRETQPKDWAKLEALHGDRTVEQILCELCKWMGQNGSLATLRQRFKCYARTLHAAFVGTGTKRFDVRGKLHAGPGGQL